MKKSFFEKWDWAAFGTATLVTLAIYVYTLGPSVGLEDSGELATAGAHLGVPHPPGYPFWTVCSWIFCRLFAWVTYMGHPTPAWCISLFSATAGALAAGCTAMLICRSARDFLLKEDERSPAHSLVCFAGGVAGALTFALSPVEWSQSTIVEIYSLNAFFLMFVFLMSYRWMRRPSDAVLWTTAFAFGLGLTNYQVLAFAIVPLALIILMNNWRMFRDVMIYLMPVLLTWQVLKVGSLQRADPMMSKDVIAKFLPVGVSKTAWIQRMAGMPVDVKAYAAHCPYTGLVTFAVVALIAALVAALVLRHLQKGDLARKTLLYGGGAAVVLFALSAAFTHPVVWKGPIEEPIAPLVDPVRYVLIGAAVAASVVSAAYAVLRGADDQRLFARGTGLPMALSIVFAVVAVMIAAAGPTAHIGDLNFVVDGGRRLCYTGPRYPWFKSILAFLACMGALFAMSAFTRKGLALAIPVAGLQTAVFVLLYKGAMNGLTHPQSWWFTWPILWNFVLLCLVALTLPTGRSVAGAAFFTQLGVAFYAYMPIVSDLRNPPMNWGYPRTWEGFKHAIERGQYEAIGLPSFPTVRSFFQFLGTQMAHYFADVRMQFSALMAAFAVLPFAFGHFVTAPGKRKLFWKWMLAAASCFLVMSFLLILLAQVKGDVQDGFIQKVKFISSHAMIALWIGYGLIVLPALILQLLPQRLRIVRLAAALGVLLIGGSLVAPVYLNYFQDHFRPDSVVFQLGGNEQNGHTFGWQFGAYQLEGAAAIRDQVEADEEPLPDPEFPPRMEDFSIFFGGTDPGRFVPTYMIYSAYYRPDVYLITQNALADDTYMSVERDLYGDEIWIPSKNDSGDAFSEYVNSMTPEERAAKGVATENGRVQVTGALSVMDINAILTKKMFEHDRTRHNFYVEESYVIPWMYDYESPHGLIMKINRDKTGYEPKLAAQDRDFWDWYVRRLLDDPMFRRDFAGQKSFSKLRAAQAGLYAHQNRRPEAAQAFREACLLYPASPESTFRYAQEILLPYGRTDVIFDLLDYTDEIDPRNVRTARLRAYTQQLMNYLNKQQMPQIQKTQGVK